MSWLETGSRAAIVAEPKLYADLEANGVGVASYIDVGGTKTDSIAGQANVSSTWSIIINAPGAFFYGGTIPGTNLAANSQGGQLLILLHELAHVTGTLPAGDSGQGMNSTENSTVFDKCQKTVLGK
jgi:hypothetical protein